MKNQAKLQMIFLDFFRNNLILSFLNKKGSQNSFLIVKNEKI